MPNALGMLGCTTLFVLLSACQPIPTVPLEPFADGRDWVVIEPMSYAIENTGQTILVPVGFVTDFASTPRAIWSFLPPFGTYQKAAVIHDYLYWMQDCTKDQSDYILWIAMTESNVSQADRQVIYSGVRIGGQAAWDQNAADRKAGLTKFVIPDQNGRIELDPNEVWSDYRQRHGQTSLDQRSPTTPGYCAVGNPAHVALVSGSRIAED